MPDAGSQDGEMKDAHMEDPAPSKTEPENVLGPPETLVPVPPEKNVSPPVSHAVVNSMSHPDAYAWLNRSAKSGRGILPPEVQAEWEAGGMRRSKLLTSFVQRVYVPHAPQHTNILRLECWNKIRQCTKDFARSFRGFEWHTEEELRTVLKWNEILVFGSYNLCNLFSMCCSGRIFIVEDVPLRFDVFLKPLFARTKTKGAVEYCKGKRLTKQCIYEKATKYLVQVSDTVEHLSFHFVCLVLKTSSARFLVAFSNTSFPLLKQVLFTFQISQLPW